MIMILVFCFICINSVKVEAQSATLIASEVEALKEIATQIGKNNWNFSVDPCSDDKSWVTPKSSVQFKNNVTCICFLSDGAWHVTTISLRGQDLAGVLPPSIAKLPYLINVDFSRNYLNGSIPREWASTKLQYL
ncbi:putative non-specific serine/threonine protein kinase [Rosa chinensis]|uniref:Putative non-specific serine/threonine protein kinase n=1 Tax=Rosa chinensis TaxID=74649 RepID=A0A2P6QAW1_ROSCH|nr:putative non-specific serine/threonine protein kinase [Rosa chinensis]